MSKEFKYVQYSGKYSDKVVRLLNTVFPDKKISKQSFTWKHFDEFFEKQSIAYIATKGGIVCSFVCFTPIDILEGVKKYLFYSCAIQATHPGYRRLGLVTKLTKLIEAKINVKNYLGFSNLSGVNIDKYSKNIAYTIVGRLYKYYLLSIPHKSIVKLRQVNNIERFPSAQKSHLHIDYTDRYVTWRYANNPKEKYLYFECMIGGKFLGYIVAKKTNHSLQVYLVDLIAENYFKDCLRSISNWCFHNGLIFSKLLLLPNDFTNKLNNLFLLKRPSNLFFTVSSSNKALENADNWLVQAGDVQ